MQAMEFQTLPDDYPKLFASRDIKKGELLFAERPLAVSIAANTGYMPWNDDIMRQCQSLKGVNAIRFELLNNRRGTKNKLPPIEVLTENFYKKYDKYGLTKSQMKLILKKKAFTKQNIGQVPYSHKTVYYSVCSIMPFISHASESNVVVETPHMRLTMAYAQRDIKQGE